MKRILKISVLVFFVLLTKTGTAQKITLRDLNGKEVRITDSITLSDVSKSKNLREDSVTRLKTDTISRYPMLFFDRRDPFKFKGMVDSMALKSQFNFWKKSIK